MSTGSDQGENEKNAVDDEESVVEARVSLARAAATAKQNHEQQTLTEEHFEQEEELGGDVDLVVGRLSDLFNGGGFGRHFTQQVDWLFESLRCHALRQVLFEAKEAE
eukprot:CAMPEP_0185568278 /NCGR_PEP_ID=MMETSP0434-20130131/1287_1 /TAXON_ID=626734 ORGANISM="Favella taraikaensis, Strain Fe Narragansett Bay" /NCGR_SAMPLE_ID=MMETSP0434 /ASSEMBLY_ACC=CAM_ASM_000379 /LENGTH=106 /DNA_ID=CAMNT_0028182741 /DNA_START=705 /DNA_END=1026 /DNA_ORIENTATION=+